MQNFDLENVDCHATLAMTKNAQSGRSLLPICEADAPLFLNDVYNKRYTREKITSRCPQSGRSMIEMLGVLAIIGVLSVGGIAGYSKAMHKYRVNKTIEQITLIAGNVRSFFAPQRSYKDIISNDESSRKILKKAKIIPEEMWEGNGLINVWGLEVNICYDNKTSSGDKQAFNMYYVIPEEVCVDMVSQDWSNAGVKAISVSEYDAYPKNGQYFKIPVSVDDAVATCYRASSKKYFMYFYFDIDLSSSVWSSKTWQN